MKMFMEITNKQLPPLDFTKYGQPFDEERTGKLVKMLQSIRVTTVMITFMTDYLNLDEHKSLRFIK